MLECPFVRLGDGMMAEDIITVIVKPKGWAVSDLTVNL